MGPMPFMPVMGVGSQQQQQPQQKDEEIESELFREISILRANAVTIPVIETEKPPQIEEEDTKIVKMRYPLIPNAPKQGERVFAWANIYFDQRYNELVYDVVEPPLTNDQKILIDEIKEYIQEKLDINFSQIRKNETTNYIIDIFNKAVQYFKIKGDLEVLKYYIIRDFIGLEILEPLLQDRNIEDISCDGVNIPIYVYHRDPKLGSLRTNRVFSRGDDLDSFVNKLSERCGKTITVAKPLLDGSLPDGSRVQSTLGSDIARHGSNFTIRMFTEKPLTPVDLINFGSCDLKLMSYLWFLIEHEASMLISGGTASGKTSILNVLSLFIKPQLKIVSIEDTAELRLPHAHWVPEVARQSISNEGEGQVDMFELLRESLRQRPDYIIVGEVRGREAYVLFQQMAVGHSGLATIHAENFVKLLDRLTTAPISLPPNLIQNLDSIIFVKRVKRGRRYMRRMSSITEILGYDKQKDRPIIGEVFKWNPTNDVYTTAGKSAVLRKIANATGLSEAEIQKELENRSKVLRWMIKKGIKDYRNVSSIVNLYYLSPDFIMNRVEAEL
jgi:archaeal flagellar protein FlaI